MNERVCMWLGVKPGIEKCNVGSKDDTGKVLYNFNVEYLKVWTKILLLGYLVLQKIYTVDAWN